MWSSVATLLAAAAASHKSSLAGLPSASSNKRRRTDLPPRNVRRESSNAQSASTAGTLSSQGASVEAKHSASPFERDSQHNLSADDSDASFCPDCDDE
eukprot:2943929-Pleurochrysis_carterae.AAC.1